VARQLVCTCGACQRCWSRTYITRRRARDPAYAELERQRARAYRARKRHAADSRAWRERRRVLEASAIEPGATLEQLAERTGRPRGALQAVLASELRLGRVLRRRDGRYCLVAASFPSGLLAALRSLPGEFVSDGNGARQSRPTSSRHVWTGT
jgi:hypothetical protein